MKQDQGFSVVEIVVAVIIIGIIAAIAVPYLISSRKSTNNEAVVATIRTIQFAQSTYVTAVGITSYGTFNDLRDETLLDASFSGASVNRNNYTIAMSISAATPPGYCIKASPVSAGAGAKYYGTNQKNVIYESTATGDINCAAGVLTVSGGAVPVTN